MGKLWWILISIYLSLSLSHQVFLLGLPILNDFISYIFQEYNGARRCPHQRAIHCAARRGTSPPGGTPGGNATPGPKAKESSWCPGDLQSNLQWVNILMQVVRENHWFLMIFAIFWHDCSITPKWIVYIISEYPHFRKSPYNLGGVPAFFSRKAILQVENVWKWGGMSGFGLRPQESSLKFFRKLRTTNVGPWVHLGVRQILVLKTGFCGWSRPHDTPGLQPVQLWRRVASPPFPASSAADGSNMQHNAWNHLWWVTWCQVEKGGSAQH